MNGFSYAEILFDVISWKPAIPFFLVPQALLTVTDMFKMDSSRIE
jgi:hypothetical protein